MILVYRNKHRLQAAQPLTAVALFARLAKFAFPLDALVPNAPPEAFAAIAIVVVGSRRQVQVLH